MPSTLQDFIDNLDSTERQEIDRLKTQFLAEEATYQHLHGAPNPRDASSGPPLAASPSRRQ